MTPDDDGYPEEGIPYISELYDTDDKHAIEGRDVLVSDDQFICHVPNAWDEVDDGREFAKAIANAGPAIFTLIQEVDRLGPCTQGFGTKANAGSTGFSWRCSRSTTET
jgi:hypothetical protein